MSWPHSTAYLVGPRLTLSRSAVCSKPFLVACCESYTTTLVFSTHILWFFDPGSFEHSLLSTFKETPAAIAMEARAGHARLTTQAIPDLLQIQQSRSAGGLVKGFQPAALAHISMPAWGGVYQPARLELDKVSARRRVRSMIGNVPGGPADLALQPETAIHIPETVVSLPVPPGSDNSALRKTLADRTERKQSGKERWSNHSERHFVNENGHCIYTQQWLPIDTPMKAAVVVLHGLNEHSGRYKRLARELTKHGYGVFGMDWYGHGRSDGLHGFVDRLDNTVRDAGTYLRSVKRQHPGVPCFLYGHSTGAAIALKTVRSSSKAEVAGLVLTAPAISITPPHPVLATLLPFFAEIAPTLQVAAANRGDLKVSRDPASLVDKYSDPLVYTGNIRVRTGSEVLRIASDVRRNLHTVRHPFLVCHGTDDQVTLPEGSEELFRTAPAVSKKLKLYKGCLHDLLLEPEKDELIADVVSWMDRQLSMKESQKKQVVVQMQRSEGLERGSVGRELLEPC